MNIKPGLALTIIFLAIVGALATILTNYSPATNQAAVLNSSPTPVPSLTPTPQAKSNIGDVFNAAGAPAPVPGDTTPPSAVTTLAAILITPQSVRLSWKPSLDTQNQVGYRLYRDGTFITSLYFIPGTVPVYEDTPTVGTHSYYVTAYDSSVNRNAALPSNTVTITTSLILNTFSIDDRVTPTQSSINIHVSPSINAPAPSPAPGVFTTVSPPTIGNITAGPIAADGYTWWQVAWNFSPNYSPQVGWVVETYLTKAPANHAPIASFIFSPSSPTTGQAVTFTSNSTDSDGDTLTYNWTFDDGFTAQTSSISHPFCTSGHHSVTLTVTDSHGLSGTPYSQIVTVAAIPNAPTATFSFTPAPPAAINLSSLVTFTSQSTDSGGTIVSVLWDFGDGNQCQSYSLNPACSDIITAQNYYSSSGTYTVTLGVTDNNGLTSSTTKVVNVTKPAIVPMGSTMMATTSALNGNVGIAIAVDTRVNCDNLNGKDCPIVGGIKGTQAYLAKYTSGQSLQWKVNTTGTISGFGSIGSQITSAATDDKGNIFVTGMISGTQTFNSTSGNSCATLTSKGDYDIFVAKYSPAGVCLWAIASGGVATSAANASSLESGQSIKTDSSGNAIVGGYFNGSLSFNALVGSVCPVLVSTKLYDGFIAKISSTGSCMWARSIKGSTNDGDITSIAVDKFDDSACVAGQYSGSADFGGGSVGTKGYLDSFIAKYSSTGDLLWSNHFGNNGATPGIGTESYVSAVALDPARNIWVAGRYYLTSSPTINFGGADFSKSPAIFLAKYSPSGSHILSKAFDDNGGNVSVDSMAADGLGNITIFGPADSYLNLGGGYLSTYPYPESSYYLASYGGTGAFRWEKIYAANRGHYPIQHGQITVDSDNNVNLVGTVAGQANLGFDSSGNEFILNSADPNITQIYLQKIKGVTN